MTKQIPKGWETKTIKEIGEVITGKTPPTSKKDYWNGNVQFITPEDINSSKYIFRTRRHITKLGADKVGNILPKDTVVVVCIGSTIGKIALTHNTCISNQQINAILCSNQYDSHYIYYAILKKEHFLKSFSGTAAVPIINKSLFEKFKISVPADIKEQQKIAEILSSVDEGIQKVEKAIKKTERLRQGLMNKLLIKGIRHKEFKETKIGKIPQKWKVRELSEIADIFSSNVDKKTLASEKKVVLCNYMDVYNNETITSVLDFMAATATDDEINKFTLKKGDVIITKDSETPGDIAKSTVVTKTINNLVCGYHLAIIRPKDSTEINSYFLSKLFSSYEIHKYFVKRAFGMTRFGLSVPAINNALFPVPEITEQRMIIEGLLSVDNKLDLQRQRKEKLMRIKQGLMNDLLTGRKRTCY